MRPWKPPLNATTPGRFVYARAILTAFSIASAPVVRRRALCGALPASAHRRERHADGEHHRQGREENERGEREQICRQCALQDALAVEIDDCAREWAGGLQQEDETIERVRHE